MGWSRDEQTTSALITNGVARDEDSRGAPISTKSRLLTTAMLWKPWPGAYTQEGWIKLAAEER